MAVESVVIYSVVNVKVTLPEGKRPESPQEALDRACEMVDLHQLFKRDRASGAVEHIQFGDEVLGGLVDFENDPEYERTVYAEGGTASSFMDNAVQDALASALAAGTAPLDSLLTIANSLDALAVSARRGVVLHRDASRDLRRGMLEALAADNPATLVEWLEQEIRLREVLAPEDLAPLLEADHKGVRETALRMLGDLRPQQKRGRAR